MRITAKHPVRAAVADISTYQDYKQDAANAVYDACKEHDIEVVGSIYDDYSQDAGRVTLRLRPVFNACVVCDGCAAKSETNYYDNVVVFSWYTMPSGRIEVTAYIS